MKFWKKWLAILVAATGCATIAFCVTMWNNISSAWSVNRQSAQYALDHTSLDHLISHEMFTASDVEDVFYGTDAFAQPWYAFVWTNPLRATQISANGVLSKKEITKIALSQGLHDVTAKIGYLDNQTANTFHTNSLLVWETYGSIDGKDAYYYYDGWTGKLLWKYVL